MDNQGNHDDWQACPPGVLTRMVTQLDARQRRARFRQLAGTGLLTMLLGAVGIILFGGFVLYEEPTFGGISCTDCLVHAAEYHNYLVGKNPAMDADLAGKIKSHLEKCGCCRAKFHQAYPDAPVGHLATRELRLWPRLPTLAVALTPAGY